MCIATAISSADAARLHLPWDSLHETCQQGSKRESLRSPTISTKSTEAKMGLQGAYEHIMYKNLIKSGKAMPTRFGTFTNTNLASALHAGTKMGSISSQS